MTTMEHYKGKVAVVTGASSGIGAAIAEKLVDHGLNVVATGRRLGKLHDLNQKLSNRPGKLFPIKADITNEKEVVQVMKWAFDKLGGIHILINNAGITLDSNLLDGGETEKWRKVFETNVIGLCVATREAVKIMKENEIEGNIININSIAGHKVIAAPGMNVYSASKYAVTNVTEAVRIELMTAGSKIKTTSISPGLVKTEIQDALSDENRKSFEKGPMLQPEDVASAIIYILSVPAHVQITELTIKPLGEPF